MVRLDGYKRVSCNTWCINFSRLLSGCVRWHLSLSPRNEASLHVHLDPWIHRELNMKLVHRAMMHKMEMMHQCQVFLIDMQTLRALVWNVPKAQVSGQIS